MLKWLFGVKVNESRDDRWTKRFEFTKTKDAHSPTHSSYVTKKRRLNPTTHFSLRLPQWREPAVAVSFLSSHHLPLSFSASHSVSPPFHLLVLTVGRSRYGIWKACILEKWAAPTPKPPLLCSKLSRHTDKIRWGAVKIHCQENYKSIKVKCLLLNPGRKNEKTKQKNKTPNLKTKLTHALLPWKDLKLEFVVGNICFRTTPGPNLFGSFTEGAFDF